MRYLKAGLLLGMGLFLLSRVLTGTLLFYISQRFAWLTVLAGAGFLVLAVAYLLRSGDEHARHEHGHDHALSLLGITLVAAPVVLGLLVPPRPLGAAAMQNREVNVASLGSVAPPGSNTRLVDTGRRERNILDWLIAFQQTAELAAFSGQEAHVIGFVYRDERFEAGEIFMVSRFAVSCCVADASAVGLIVRWPEAGALAKDQWVEVKGRFAVGEFADSPTPVLIATEVELIDPPGQPYLYY